MDIGRERSKEFWSIALYLFVFLLCIFHFVMVELSILHHRQYKQSGEKLVKSLSCDFHLKEHADEGLTTQLHKWSR